MRSIFSFFISCILAGLVLSGCNTSPAAQQAVQAPSEEQRLVIYTSHKDVIYDPLIREFEARTGIWVQVETGDTMELLERIAAEGENTTCDLLFGGGVDTLEAYKEFFSPYTSPLLSEVDPAHYSVSHHWTPLSCIPLVLTYNSKLVRLNPPSGWEDLLDSTWARKIAYATPGSSASAFTALSTLLQIFPDMQAKDVLQQFAQNLGGEVLSSSGSVIDEIAHGNRYIGIAQEDEVLRSIDAGYDVAMVYPKEGTSMICDGLAILTGCSHPTNAQRFIDFVLSKDAQQYLLENCHRRSVRTDLSLSNLPDVPDVLSYDLEWASHNQAELLSLWEELLKEVTP